MTGSANRWIVLPLSGWCGTEADGEVGCFVVTVRIGAHVTLSSVLATRVGGSLRSKALTRLSVESACVSTEFLKPKLFSPFGLLSALSPSCSLVA